MEQGERTAAAPARRVLIVDDHRAFAEALQLAIRLEPDLECAGITRSVGEALSVVADLQPDVIVLDVHLPDGSGLTSIEELKRSAPGARVVVLTADRASGLVLLAASSGASGFLTKDAPLDEVIDVIRSVTAHGMLIDVDSITSAFQDRPSSPNGGMHGASLTERESQVLGLMGQGLHTAGIAKSLNLSHHTVRGHVKSILAKLGVHSQLAAVVEATRRGILEAQVPASE